MCVAVCCSVFYRRQKIYRRKNFYREKRRNVKMSLRRGSFFLSQRVLQVVAVCCSVFFSVFYSKPNFDKREKFYREKRRKEKGCSRRGNFLFFTHKSGPAQLKVLVRRQ